VLPLGLFALPTFLFPSKFSFPQPNPFPSDQSLVRLTPRLFCAFPSARFIILLCGARRPPFPLIREQASFLCFFTPPLCLVTRAPFSLPWQPTCLCHRQEASDLPQPSSLFPSGYVDLCPGACPFFVGFRLPPVVLSPKDRVGAPLRFFS